jgi:alkylhydroperoxidase/carboxymuconolactone decarboxylase family protein YurZ
VERLDAQEVEVVPVRQVDQLRKSEDGYQKNRLTTFRQGSSEWLPGWKRETIMTKESNAAEKLIGNFAPKLVELTDRVLFDDIWERKELSPRDRSLVTVAALIAFNRPDQLRFHFGIHQPSGTIKRNGNRHRVMVRWG